MANPFANRAGAKTTEAAPVANNTPAAEPAPAPAEQAAPASTGQALNAPKPSLSERFSNGAVGGGDKIQDLQGHAVLIRTDEIVKEMKTANGVTDAARASWIALDGPRQGEEFSGLIFGKVIVGSLESQLNSGQRLCVGVLDKGVAKGSHSAPWLLNPLDDTQLALAEQAADALNWF
ncbi:hypothetical protein QEH32_gp29 [Corynebacterium phage EmiRose]|uniref:Uncharacterized protein n=1 Tax=Corynebacterium phage EmiRose TaxID=2565372 RepID=A0A649VPI1_9CAUD|nr:hypothetical protein QEH32_gp29 [Corynebacterium phage EmiRose]QGJ94161.1 hypothetical protein SEA_EMIROSE_29 [Corynebacterium phage EmiRose]